MTRVRRRVDPKFIALAVASAVVFLGGCAKSSSTPDPGSPWSFAVVCDSRSSYASDPLGAGSPYYSADGNSPYLRNVASALAREEGLDFVIYPGDLTRGKKPYLTGQQFADALDQWNTYMQPVYDAGIPVYLVRGNHDAYEVTNPDPVLDPTTSIGNAAEIWQAHTFQPGHGNNPDSGDVVSLDESAAGGLTTYSFTHRGSLFVGIDEYPNGASSPTGFDQAFLNAQLAMSASHRFAFAHQPIWNYKSDELGPTGLADDLEAGKVDLYFSGHVHSYQRISEAGYGFQEMLIGMAGAPQDDPDLVSGGAYTPDPNLIVQAYAGGLNANARFGYAVITVHPDGTLTSVMKFLDHPTSPTSTVSPFDAANVTRRP